MSDLNWLMDVGWLVCQPFSLIIMASPAWVIVV